MSASTTMSDRERLIELLRELWQAGDNADDLEILDIVYRNLYQELRPLLLWEFGPQVDRRHASTRFTELLNRFFAKVMRAWEQSGDPLRRQWVRLINYRYVLLETQERTARDLEVNANRYKQLHKQALEQFRREEPQ
jgi:hypothetical protein